MIQKLDVPTLTTLYEHEMTHTFPRAELKPLKSMLRMHDEGNYDILGYFDDDDNLLAYACACTATTPVLLDYLAVVSEHRGKGIGSRFLSAIQDDDDLYPSIMLEIEAVDAAENDADRQARHRRQRFYERLGFTRTPIQAHVFGEHYWVLTDSADHPPCHINDAMTETYRYMVPDRDTFAENVRIWHADA